jgi:8-oxo-dGTP diphosphatase
VAHPGPKHSVSVAATVVNDSGQVLAVRRRDNGQWEPPGGVLELGETIEEGLIREVREETGLVVAPERLTGVYKNMRHKIIALVFRCRVVSGTVTAGAETVEVRWMGLAEVREHMNEAFATRLLDSFEAEAPVVRTHDGVRVLRV